MQRAKCWRFEAGWISRTCNPSRLRKKMNVFGDRFLTVAVLIGVSFHGQGFFTAGSG